MRNVLLFVALAGCYNPPDFESLPQSEWTDTAAMLDDTGSPAARFLNAWEVSTLEELDHGCGLRSDSAQALHARRAGPNGWPGDGDDWLFETDLDVLAVPMVGEATLELLHVCADRWGF